MSPITVNDNRGFCGQIWPFHRITYYYPQHDRHDLHRPADYYRAKTRV